ncbi:S8 family serine peptidase [Spirilliplanes yamanashiensis]|uniref:Peptidase S8/S53 domain-containing protein n=1 Tax=Spirilliplanes yamanashiensis TaxID=42233 RepID=A0A8J4DIN0_9ACTN|nr:S8 family serine peptidase [Spirilliplanes yamanashiensis]MDP9814479.1 subtilisin family serine protease [Spirilliplanes yamanashiensis]GIJ02130.1 hypothetical protein Sya03_14820 [Spirilliplanes yamanashiensis]
MQRHTGPGAGAVVATVFVGLGATAAAVLGSGAGWVVEQLGAALGTASPGWLWPLVAVLATALVAAGAWPLAVAPRAAVIRAAGRAWLTAGLAAGALTALRAIPAAHHEAYLAASALVAGAAALLVRGARGAVPPRARVLAAAAGLVVALPWLWTGALGGVTETLLAVLAAAAVGLLAARVLGPSLWQWYASSPALLVLGGGTVAAVALTLLAAGTGHAGTNLAELLVLPPLGYALAALYALSLRLRGGAAPAAWLVGVAAAGPLAFTDPEELTILLATGRDAPAWAAIAAGLSWLLAVLTAGAYGVWLARRSARAPRRATALVTAFAVVAAGGAVHAAAGQPGLHGERLFVVMREQADLGGVAALGTGAVNRDARVAETYRRLVATATASQAGIRAALDDARLPYTPYYLVNGLEVAGGPEVRAWLAARDDVARVLLSQRARPLPAPPAASRGELTTPPAAPWNLAAIGVPRVAGATGAGITVGGSDSGVDGRHPALAGRFRGFDDSWHDPWNGTTAPTDRNGHGTHTLATAVGARGVGVAPGAQWVGCVNLARNLGNPAKYLDCLQFMLAPFPPGGDPFTDGRPRRAPHVLTNSWGCPEVEGCDTGALRPAVDAFAAAGVFFVAAAGNTGPRCGSVDAAPAPYPSAFTVGAVGDDGRVTDFSSRGGGKPDLVAPGAGIVSALPGGTYGALDGTSMATPHVAGVVALVWSAQPALVGDVERTRRLLVDTAVPVTGPCGGAGAGRVDAYAAVTAARALR